MYHENSNLVCISGVRSFEIAVRFTFIESIVRPVAEIKGELLRLDIWGRRIFYCGRIALHVDYEDSVPGFLSGVVQKSQGKISKRISHVT